MPKIAALGGMSSRGFGEFAQQTAANYIEDVFSTWLYTGNGSTQTITNGIDLAGKGGVIWTKPRSSGVSTGNHWLTRWDVGGTGYLVGNTNTTTAYNNGSASPQTVSNTGFVLPAGQQNENNFSYASWTFRKAPKFFDVVTYTGNGTASQIISHNLQSIPGFIVVKAISTTSDWVTCCRYTDTNYFGGNGANNFALNTTAVAGAGVSPVTRGITSTSFDAGKLSGTAASWEPNKANASGVTYIAYVFAHDAGGFGADGTQNVISCGSFTTDGGGSASVTLGYEPQWLMVKRTDSAQNWFLVDIMRGMPVDSTQVKQLNPNLSNAESTGLGLTPSSTGFNVGISASATYIYMAIRRGPMRTPTSGTSVFAPYNQSTGTGSITVNYGITPDLVISKKYNGNPGAGNPNYTVYFDRLRGSYRVLYENQNPAAAEFSSTTTLAFDTQNGAILGTDTPKYVAASSSYMHYPFVRAPKFFDTVCYTGTGSAQNITHNLGTVPQLILIKSRGTVTTWFAYANSFGPSYYFIYNGTFDVQNAGSSLWNSTNPTSSVFSVGSYSEVNGSGDTFVAHLFGSCPGVSSIGTYTGTGSTQTINCGFTGGARFVMIKRTDSSSDWNVFDTTRGMVAGADYYISFYSAAAQTNANNVYTATGGFQLVSSDANFNANGGTYLYLAIA